MLFSLLQLLSSVHPRRTGCITIFSILLTFIFFFIVNIYHYSFGQVSNNERNNFEKIISLGLEQNDLLIQIDDIESSINEDIILVDKLDVSIKIYNKKGKLKNKIGKHIIKDTNFKFPSKISVSKNYMAISMYVIPYIFILNNKYENINKIKTRSSIFDISFDPEENLWVGENTGIKNKNLFKYNINGNLLDSIPLINSSGNLLNDIFNLYITKDGIIIVAYVFLNKIEIWKINGEFIREFSIGHIPLYPEYIDNEDIKVPKGILIASLTYNRGKIYLLGGHYTKNPFKDIYIYDILGNFINQIILPNTSSQIFFQENGYLFTVEDKKKKVVKYKVR